MKKQFVKTSNYETLTKAIRRAEHRGAAEAGIIFVQGHPAVSKTATIEQYAVNDPGCVHLRAKEGWTPRQFMDELADELEVDAHCRGGELFRRVVEVVNARNDPEKYEKPFKLVIDEVQHCLKNNAAVLEKVRDISDFTECIVILVAGVADAWKRVRAHPQITSRVFELVAFDVLTRADVAAFCAQMSDVKIESDLVDRIHRDSQGLTRLVINAIASVDQLAKLNKLERVGAADCEKFPLCIDWHSSKTGAFPKRA